MANTIYANVVLENKYDSVLNTKLEMSNYMTIDNTLAVDAGLVKKVITKTATGAVDEVAQGSGNTNFVEVSTATNDYTVKTVQGQFVYYDEEALADPAVVDAGLTGLTEKMVNKFVADAVGEMDKAELQQGYTKASGIAFNDIVDALAQLNMEDEANLFMLISPASVAQFRKNLKDNLSYSEDFVRTGYIGNVCGVPVYVSKAIADGVAYIATKEAVTNFIKKDSEIEQDRDIDLRKNFVVARKVYVVALTDANKIVKVAPNQATAATITTYTKSAKTIAGAAATGAKVQAYVNGVATGSIVTAADNAYSITATSNLAANDVVKVVAKLDGYIDSVATVTVAA